MRTPSASASTSATSTTRSNDDGRRVSQAPPDLLDMLSVVQFSSGPIRPPVADHFRTHVADHVHTPVFPAQRAGRREPGPAERVFKMGASAHVARRGATLVTPRTLDEHELAIVHGETIRARPRQQSRGEASASERVCNPMTLSSEASP